MPPDTEPKTPEIDPFLRRLRTVVVVTGLALLVFVVVVVTFGRLFVRPDFDVPEFLTGTIFGLIVTGAGIEGLVRLVSK